MNKIPPKEKIGSFLKLTKPVITLSVGFSALTGFILFNGAFSQGWFYMYLGVLFVAAGSSVINQIQERNLDKLMDRTLSRPIPSGQVSPIQAWIMAAILGLSGVALLWVFVKPVSAILAITTLLWYNGIYTPLKRVSPWAIIPGAVVGALPPVIGWTAAGGYLFHPHIVFVSFFFFIGQIPHFWLILLRYGHDYEKAGFPSVSKIFSQLQISRLTFTWTTATAAIAVFLPLFGIIESIWLGGTIVILSAFLVLSFHKWPGIKNPVHVNRAFMIMNFYFLSMMIIIIADSLLR
jgi:heme o synthase